MESPKTLSKIFNIIFPFTDFLYLLQQEEYSFQRIWFWLPRFFFRRNVQQRDKIVYTQRVKVTLTLAILLFVTLNILGFLYSKSNIILFVVLCLLIPIIVLISNLLLQPFYILIKNRIIKKASLYFKNAKNGARVIAITGSYGKTTVKNFIEQLVKFSYKTQMIPGNINSTIGIANWILNDFKEGTEILIVEMDSYYPKRIMKSTELVSPDIAILTNIGDQHLQRYKTKENLAKSLFELFEYSPKKAIKITGKETLNYLNEQKFETKDVITVKENGASVFDKNLQYALFVSDILKIPAEYVEHISKNIVLPKRRMSPVKIFGFDGIDDSYNISFTTASAGITEAFNQSRKNNKKLLVITAGIPELGPLEQDRNIKLGELLDEKADKILVLKSIYSKNILFGINHKEKVSIHDNFKMAIQNLQKNYSQKEYFLLIQPELTDLYY